MNDERRVYVNEHSASQMRRFLLAFGCEPSTGTDSQGMYFDFCPPTDPKELEVFDQIYNRNTWQPPMSEAEGNEPVISE
jgi:hypothetical protein